jgi:hypothetical protein
MLMIKPCQEKVVLDLKNLFYTQIHLIIDRYEVLGLMLLKFE